MSGPACAERYWCPSPVCDKPRSECPCGFCHGKPVGNAASWIDGKPRPPAACPRCGVTTRLTGKGTP